MNYNAKIFLNETQISLNLIFNDFQMERLFINMEPGDIIKYVGEASNAEEAAELMGLNKLKNNDRELYYYITATFVSLATMTTETEIYKNTLESIMRSNINNEEEVKELIKNTFDTIKRLYYLDIASDSDNEV